MSHRLREDDEIKIYRKVRPQKKKSASGNTKMATGILLLAANKLESPTSTPKPTCSRLANRATHFFPLAFSPSLLACYAIRYEALRAHFYSSPHAPIHTTSVCAVLVLVSYFVSALAPRNDHTTTPGTETPRNTTIEKLTNSLSSKELAYGARAAVCSTSPLVHKVQYPQSEC